MASPPRGRCNSRGKGLEETSPGKIRFQRKPGPGPDLEDRSPQCYNSQLPNPLPTRKCEKQLLLATQKRSLEENLPCQSGLSTIFLGLLTIFSVIFSMTPGGHGRQKNSFTLFERH